MFGQYTGRCAAEKSSRVQDVRRRENLGLYRSEFLEHWGCTVESIQILPNAITRLRRGIMAVVVG